MNTKLLLSLPLFLSTLFCIAQETHEHNQETHEIGFSVGPVYFTNEKAFSVGTHLHYVYYFPHTKFGIGAGYERIFDEHKHNFIGFEINYNPVHRITLNLSPGVAFEGEHKDEKEFAFHFETVYEFEFDAVHIGPFLELAYHPDDFHISLGVHIGFGF